MKKCTATINLLAIKNNYLFAKNLAPHSKTIAIIKANAYGHGMLKVAKILLEADGFGVARIDEALCLRKCSNNRIIILGGIFNDKELKQVIKYNFEIVVHNMLQLNLIKNFSSKLTIWLKFDSGMGRLGFDKGSLNNALKILEKNPNITIIIMSHLAVSDEIDNNFTNIQIANFNKIQSNYPKSLANSAAILHFKKTNFDYNRPGIMLYGISPIKKYQKFLQPSMTLSAPIISIKKLKKGDSVGYGRKFICDKNMKVGIVAVGYADGYPRLTNKSAKVWLNGKTTITIGAISMDSLAIDLSEVEAQIGDNVELFGENISLNSLAKIAKTISYDILTKITNRVELRYN